MPLTVLLNTSVTDAPAIGEHVVDTCRAAGVDAHVIVTDGHALTERAREAVAAGATCVAAGGGDGTMNAVATALADTPVPLGVLPLGTLNHFARDCGIPRDLDQAIAVLVAGRARRVDVGDVNGRLFLNNSSVGLYPRLVWEREQRQRQGRRKWVAMAAAAATVWRRYRRVSVRLRPEDGSVLDVRTPFVFVGNNTYQLSGLEFGARRQLDQGHLHVCMAPELSAAGVARVFGAVLTGRLVQFAQFESLETGELTIAARRHRLGVSLDGETTVLTTPLRYRSRPGALAVMVP